MGDLSKDGKGEALTLQVRKIGNSVGVIFPKELLHRLRLKEGDTLHVVEQPDRDLKLTPYDPRHAEALEFARKAFQEYGDTFRELAK